MGTEKKETKAEFLAALKEQAQREGWARRTYHPEDRTYEARRYDDGVLCRRVDEFRPGDRVKYLRNSTGEEIEGEIVRLRTFPEDRGQYAGQVWYNLHLDKDTADRVGHPVTIPHPRVSLVWPQEATQATAFVVLHEGRRLGWKVLRGSPEHGLLNHLYYGQGPERPDYAACIVERQPFTDWNDAVRWCASFPAHPAEAGAKPDEEPPKRPAPEPAETRPAVTVLGGNLREKARENRRRVKVGDRVTITAAVAPPERSGEVIEVDQSRGGVRVLHDGHKPEARGLCWTWAEFSIDPALGEPVGGEPTPSSLAQTTDAISAMCTQYLEDGGCPGGLADSLREQADVLCSLD